MDEILKGFLQLGTSGVALYVFWQLMSKMLDKHSLERQAAQSSFQATLDNIVKNFREEQVEARETCKEEGKVMMASFEKNLADIKASFKK